jgi:pimeloyl-ACP methyl ester carboxylesterase
LALLAHLQRGAFNALTPLDTLPAIILVLAMSLLASCASLRSEREQAEKIGQNSGLTAATLQTPHFPIFAQTRISQPGQELTIYIEGDGDAWLSRNQLSADPTPVNPLALKLAALDPAANVAWLARPCQYLLAQSPNCSADYWSTQRYSRELVVALDAAITQLKTQAAAQRLNLIGYSGGAAMALLIAAQRNDIASVRTIAGNLDTEAFTRHHQVTPLAPESNPLSHAEALAKIPQIHWLGENDNTIPPPLAYRYANAVGQGNCTRLQTVANATHSSGWEKRWIDYLNTPLPCAAR